MQAVPSNHCVTETPLEISKTPFKELYRLRLEPLAQIFDLVKLLE